MHLISTPDDTDPNCVSPDTSFEMDADSRNASGEDAGEIRQSARFVLRERTAKQHEATEAAFAPYNLQQSTHYAAFLTAHLTALDGVETAIAGAGWAEWQPRAPLVLDDLLALAHQPRPMQSSDIGLLTPAAKWGAQYVLEGSALGGVILAKRVPDGLAKTYLTRKSPATNSWRAFCDALDHEAAQNPSSWLEEAICGAEHAFSAFRQAAKQMDPTKL